MRLRILLSLSLLLATWQKAGAQLIPADDFFHGGAQLYLSNNIPEALNVVTNARKFYPDDSKLKKLEELLKQENQQQQQQQQNQQQNNQSSADQKKDQSQKQPDHNQKKDPSQAKDQKSDDQKKQQSKADPAPEKKDEKKAEQQQAKKDDDQRKPEDQKEGQAVAAGEMTPKEAKQLLDNQKNDEMLMPVSRKEKAANQQGVLKDW